MLSDPQIRESPRESDGNLLIIGYGNPLRGDDGVGPRVVEAVAAMRLPGVHTMVCHQLTPELAELVAAARLVVFVDAEIEAPEVGLRPLAAAENAEFRTHASDPAALLALAGRLFGRCPRAWWLTIPVADLGFGDALSPVAQRGLATALQEIRSLVARNAGEGSSD